MVKKVIKKMIYRGNVILKNEILGLSFKELDGDEEIFCKGKNKYCIGEVYEFEFTDDKRFTIGDWLEDENFDDVDKIKEWELKSLENKAWKSKQLRMRHRKKDEGIILNMSLRELKYQCHNDYRFKRIVLHYLLGNSL